MDPVSNVDVNAAETATASTQSSTDQTTDSTVTTDQTADQNATTDQVDNATDKNTNVPYSRFKEVNDKYRETTKTVTELETKLRELEAKAQAPAATPEQGNLREQLKQAGYLTREEMEAALARRDLEVKQRELDQALESNLKELEKEYPGTDGRPKFSRREVLDFGLKQGIYDPAIAYEVLHKKEITNWHIAQAATKSKGVKSETSDGSGSSQAGTTNDDLKKAIEQGDKSALRTFLKRQMKS